MSETNETPLILLDIAAELDSRSFEEALKKYQEWKKKFSSLLGAGFFDKGAGLSVQKQLEKYVAIDPDKLISPQAIGNITRKINDINNVVKKLDFSSMLSKAQEAGELFDREAAEIESSADEFSTRLKKIMQRHVYADKAPLLKDAFKVFFGSDTEAEIAKTIGTMDKLMVAEKEYEKWMFAHNKMTRMYGSQWEKNTSFAKLFEGVRTRNIEFDKDTGFKSSNYEIGSDILGIDQKTLESMAKRREQVSASLDKVGVLNQKGYLSGIGSSASRESLAYADLAGNITLTNRKLEIHNAEGLKAVGITTEHAARLGLLSSKFGGQGLELQKLEKRYKNLADEQKLAFSAINPDKSNLHEYKAALDAVGVASTKAFRHGIVEESKKAALAVEEFKKRTSPEQVETRFDKMYASARPQTKFAMDTAKLVSGDDTAKLNTFLDVIKKVDSAVTRYGISMNSAGRDGDRFVENANVLKMSLSVFTNQLEVSGKAIVSVKEKLSDLDKFKEKALSGKSNSYASGFSSLLEQFGGNFNDSNFKAMLKLLDAAEKAIATTVAQMRSLGASEDDVHRFVSSIDSATLAFDKNSKASQSAASLMDRVGKQHSKVVHPTTLLSRALTDLYEKFKILSGYAISGSIAYGIGNMFAQAVVNVVKYDQALHDLKAITQASSAQTEEMGNKILQVSMSSKYGILEVTEAMKNLGQAGLTAQQTMETIKPVTQLATATGANLKQVSDLVTSVVESFDIPYEETTKVVDILGSAVNRSKLDIEKLSTAFNYIGPVAHDAGVSLEETAAAMSIMSNSGIKASTMATSLRQIFDKILNPSKELKEALDMAGMSLDDINPQMHSLAEVIGKLAIVVPDTATALALFDQRGASTFLALASAGKSGIEQMTKNMQQAGAVAIMYEEQMAGLESKLKSTRNSLEVFGILGGEAFKVGNIIDFFAGKFKSLLDTINNANGPVSGFIKNFALMATTIAGVGVVVGGVISNISLMRETLLMSTSTSAVAIRNLGTWISGLSMSFMGLTVSGGMVAAGIVVLVTAIAGLITYLSNLKTAEEQATATLKEKIEVQTIAAEKEEISAATAKKYREIIVDSQRPLEERKYAFEKLSQMCDTLDASTMDNVTSIESFDQALKNSMPVIDSYISKLDLMSREARRALADSQAALYDDNLKTQKRLVSESRTLLQPQQITAYDLSGEEYSADVGVDVESLRKNESKLNDVNKAISDYNQQQKQIVERVLKSRADLKSSLEDALRNGDSKKISELQKTIFEEAVGNFGGSERSMSLKTAISDMIASYKTPEGNANLFTARLDQIKFEAAKDNKTGSIANYKSQISSMGSAYKDNLNKLNKAWEDEKQSAIFQSLSPEAKEARQKTHENRLKVVESQYTKASGDSFSQVWGTIEKQVDNEVKEAKLAVAKMRYEGGKDGMSDQQMAEKEEEIMLNGLKKKKDLLAESVAILKQSGPLADKVAAEIKEQEISVNTAYYDAMNKRTKQTSAANKRDSAASDKELREQLKALKKTYELESARIQADEAISIEATKKDITTNAREEASLIYDIKLKSYEQLLELARAKAEAERKIILAHGGDPDSSAMKTEIEKLEKDLANLKGNRANEVQKNDESDRVEKVSLAYERQALAISTVKNAHARSVMEEELSYKKSKDALDTKLKDGTLSYENHYAAVENLAMQHAQIMKELDSSWSSGVEKAVDNFVSSVGTWSDQVEGLVSNSFGYMSDSLAEFALTSSTSVQDLINSMLKDFTKLASNKLLQNLLDPLFSKQSGGTATSWLGGFADSIKGFFGGSSSPKNNVASNALSALTGSTAAQMNVTAGVVNIAGGVSSGSAGGALSALGSAAKSVSGNENVAGAASSTAQAIEAEQAGFFSNLWTNISGFFSNLGGGFMSFFSSIGNALSGLFSGGGSGGSGFFGSLLSGAMGLFGFANGGEVPGYSPSNTADNIFIRATAKEFVQPVPTVEYYGRGIMEGMRTRSIPKDIFANYGRGNYKVGSSLAEGGEVSGNTVEASDKKEQPLHIVNILDQSMLDQYMSTSAGSKAVLNIISRNPSVINNMLERK